MSKDHSGGYSDPVHGTTETGHDVTAAFGQGSSAGQTMLSDGHKDASSFWGTPGHEGHDHYGSGNGPNDNGTDRGAYTGPGSTSKPG